jgi:hypothetical protein
MSWKTSDSTTPTLTGPYSNRWRAFTARDHVRSRQRRDTKVAEVIPIERGGLHPCPLDE